MVQLVGGYFVGGLREGQQTSAVGGPWGLLALVV